MKPEHKSSIDKGIIGPDSDLVRLNDNSIFLLKNPLSIYDWDFLAFNSNFLPLLKNHSDKINWNILAVNPDAIYLYGKKKR